MFGKSLSEVSDPNAAFNGYGYRGGYSCLDTARNIELAQRHLAQVGER